MSDEISKERTKRGLRKVKSLNLRSEEQLEKIAQGPDDLLNLMRLKKILHTGEVFDSGLDTTEKGELFKNRLKLNEQAKNSQKLPAAPVVDEPEEEELSAAKQSDNKRSSGGPKKSSFREVDQKELEELESPVIETMNPKTKKREEWDEVETSLKLEFWKNHSIINGDYYKGFAIQGWRQTMEDTMDSKSSINPEVPNMFGVYDGHGGESCAKYCKSFLLQQLAKRPDLSSNTKSALADQFLSVDTDYNKSPPEPNAGSTATVLCVLPIDVEAREKAVKKSAKYAQTTTENPRFRKSQKLSKESTSDRLHKSIRKTASFRENKHEYKFYCASAGDSRAVLIYSSGKVVPLSVDHNLRRTDELERIKQGDGEIRYDPEFNELLVYSADAERGLNVTRTIGDKDFKPLVTAFPDVKEGFLTKDAAFFVVASDGLWAQVNNDEVGRIILEYGLTDGLKNLANLSNSRGCFDNCTVLGIDVQKMVKTMELHLNAQEA